MEEKLSTEQNKNFFYMNLNIVICSCFTQLLFYFFQKNINIVICSIFCTALWGSAFPCVKLGYELFNIGVDDTFSKILFAGWRFFLAGILVLLIATCMQKKFPKLKKESVKGIALLGFVETTLEYVFFYIGLSYASGFKGAILNPTSTISPCICTRLYNK